MDGSIFEAMRMPRWLRSCYNCARGCKGPGIADMIADDGQTCGFWKPSEGTYIPSVAELEGLKRLYQETGRRKHE